MKYLKTFEKMMSNFTLYHGSPYLFSKFKNNITFFSDNSKFAYDYASEKSSDNELDQSPVIYTCKLNGKIFDANIEEHLKQLDDALPDKITCYMSNFCFPTDYKKQDILELLKGDDIIEPVDNIINAKIGDNVDDPYYKYDKLIVVDVDDDYVYTIDKKTFSYYLNGAESISYGDNKFGYEYRKYFEDFRNYIKSIFKGTDIYRISDHLTGIFLDKKYHKTYLNIEITDEQYEKGVELYNIAKENMMKEYASKYKKSWNKKPKKIKLDDTWRYYENDSVSNTIEKLGFVGYVAKEKKHNTYAIFNPKETIVIESIYYEVGEFKNLEEISKYNRLMNELYKHYDSSFGYERYDVYNYYIKGMTLDEIISELDKKNKE